MRRRVPTPSGTLEVIAVVPTRGSATHFRPFVRLSCDEGPFSLTMELSPVEAECLAVALRAEAALVRDGDR